MPSGVGLVAVAVERLREHFDIGLVGGVSGGFLDEERTVGLAFLGLHDGVVGYAARFEGLNSCHGVGREIPKMGFAFEHDLLAGRGDHGATGLGGVDIVAHLTVLIGIEVADGGCTVGLNARSCGVVVHTREDNIRLGVIGIVVLERVGHEASRPVLGVRPVVADITIPIVVLAGVEREGISTEEALGELAGVTVTDLILAFGLHGGEVGGTVGGRRSFGLLEHCVETIGGDGICSALEGFERITAGVEGLGGHGHKEAGVRTITAAEGDLSVVDGKFIVGHTHILVGAGIHFTP